MHTRVARTAHSSVRIRGGFATANDAPTETGNNCYARCQADQLNAIVRQMCERAGRRLFRARVGNKGCPLDEIESAEASPENGTDQMHGPEFINIWSIRVSVLATSGLLGEKLHR